MLAAVFKKRQNTAKKTPITLEYILYACKKIWREVFTAICTWWWIVYQMAAILKIIALFFHFLEEVHILNWLSYEYLQLYEVQFFIMFIIKSCFFSTIHNLEVRRYFIANESTTSVNILTVKVQCPLQHHMCIYIYKIEKSQLNCLLYLQLKENQIQY